MPYSSSDSKPFIPNQTESMIMHRSLEPANDHVFLSWHDVQFSVPFKPIKATDSLISIEQYQQRVAPRL